MLCFYSLPDIHFVYAHDESVDAAAAAADLTNDGDDVRVFRASFAASFMRLTHLSIHAMAEVGSTATKLNFCHTFPQEAEAG